MGDVSTVYVLSVVTIVLAIVAGLIGSVPSSVQKFRLFGVVVEVAPLLSLLLVLFIETLIMSPLNSAALIEIFVVQSVLWIVVYAATLRKANTLRAG